MSVSFPQEEEATLKRWDEINAFHRQLELSKGRKPYTFYDGPPFATGTPHYGHILSSTIKDVVPRFWSMKGYHVVRRFGWDTHGVPIEYEIDKKYQKSARDLVAELGIAKYNDECRAIVMRFAAEWRRTITRLGRWVDFDDDYKTMNATFMESVWWSFKQLTEKGLVYRGYRVLPYSTALATPLSNFEAQSNYKDTQDPAVVVSFPLRDDPETCMLAWTTTPWTLPSNIALAVNPDLEYIKILDEASGKHYILLETLLRTLYKDVKKAKFKIVKRLKGNEMQGWKYIPLFDYFYDDFKDHGFRVLTASYVSADSGTGVVHQSPAFGEDDFNVAMEHQVITDKRLPPNPVDDHGNFTSDVTDFVGQHVKTADKAIIKHLKANDRLIVESQITHSYPFCWRSDTPLIYRSVSTWFVKIPEIREKMMDEVEKTHWVPQIVKNRFKSWVGSARDWNISRDRYWGCPIPMWVSDDFQEMVAIGSIQELKDLSGYQGDLTDLHRDKIDDITIPSKTGKGVLRRISPVFDCWFESGSMPYASNHYPFTNESTFHQGFPGDFIAEGLDQTRGWFYTLLVLGVHVFNTSPFKNVVVNGIVLAEDGKKMSKRLKNYPDPELVINQYGSDALRLYLISSPVVRAEPLRFKESGVKEVVAKVLLPMWNSLQFFKQQAALLKKVEDTDFTFSPSMSTTNVMDRWILASCQSLLKFVDGEMAAYRLYTVIPGLLGIVTDVTNWYIRFNRRRLKGELGVTDTVVALNTLCDVLFTIVRGLAPFAPFITDTIYQHLLPYIPKELHGEDPRSVHFLPFPEAREELFDPVIERQVNRMQRVIELARICRERRSINLKTPLKTLTVIAKPEVVEDVKSLETYICEELNVRDLVCSSDEEKYNVQYAVSADFSVLGKRLKKDAVRVKKALPGLTSAQIKQFITDKTISVEGIELTSEDLIVKRMLQQDDSNKNLEVNADDRDILIILDAANYPELAQEGLAREVINRIQKLRKKAGLVPTDDVKMEYKILGTDSLGIDKAVMAQTKMFEKALRRQVDKHEDTEGDKVERINSTTAGKALILEEEDEVQGVKLLLRLLML